MRILVLVRHGESEWNRLNRFTGSRNPGLTDKGIIEARLAGRLLKEREFVFNVAFTSLLRRAQQTLDAIIAELDQSIEVRRDKALNERSYGVLEGLNRDEARLRWGAEQLHRWRRTYDIPPPGGESLKDTAARVLAYYQSEILPELTGGKSVLVSAHSTSLRTLVMHIEGLSPDEIANRDLRTAIPTVYRLTRDGRLLDRQDLEPEGFSWWTSPHQRGSAR